MRISSVVDVFNRKSPAELHMLQAEGRDRVYRFIADDRLWDEIYTRFYNGQTIGQAFMNAGDHADRPYSWELDFDTVSACRTWGYLALILDRYYGTEANPKMQENYTA